MLESKNLLRELELFEELDDRASEKISGGELSLEIELSGITTSIIELQTSKYFSNLSEEIKKNVPDIDQMNNVVVLCVNEDCTVKADGKEYNFMIETSIEPI